MSTRRALLFMPGDDRRKIEKSITLGVDTVIMDLEDGVALNNKAAARETIASALRELDFGSTEKLVRTNAITDNHLYIQDIQATVHAHPDGYVLPKIETSQQIHNVEGLLSQAELHNGWQQGSLCLIAIIETARGILNLREIVGASTRLQALAFGAEDLAGDIGAIRTPDAWEVFYARSAVVLHAKAFGLQAIDTPFVNLTADDSMLVTETQQAHYMGYTGKLAIHPKQVPVIQKIFTPTTEQIEHAKRLLEAHDAHQAEGRGVFVFDGKMVDMPMVRAAETILKRAQAAGMTV